MTNSENDLKQAREWHRQGDIAKARTVYERIIKAEPGNAQAHHLLGVATLQQGDPEGAAASIRSAIDLDDTDPQFHNNLGEALRTLGRHQEALESYRRARAIAPGFAIAINNEGATCQALGQGPAAIQCFRDAVAADASFLPAHVNLGLALLGMGDPAGALASLTTGISAHPENHEIRRYFVLAAMQAPADAIDETAAARVQALFQDDNVDLQKLVRPALAILGHRGGPLRLHEADDRDILDGGLDDDLNDALLHGLLTRTVVANSRSEVLFTRLRKLCLESYGGGLAQRLPVFAAALAQQCFITDYAYQETEAEGDAVADLARQVEAMIGQADWGDALNEAVAVVAMYRPLSDLTEIEAAQLSANLGSLLQQQVYAPATEVALAAETPELSQQASEDAVRLQYEEAPYPRWLSTDQRTPAPIGVVLNALFPNLRLVRAGTGTARVLIAGCGTGKQAVDAARQYHGAKITAIDLSRASLGYARRMAGDLDGKAISFMRADIMELGGWAERFDLIECSGVLHHMADPEAGWDILRGLLAPGSVMKVALYSAMGRRDLRATRELVGAGNDEVTAARLRRARADILELPDNDPRRRVIRFTDFYSLRGCRDLLFNAQEQEYNLLEVASILRRLGLEFIGFQFADAGVKARYQDDHPGARLDDLAQWHEFETAHPDTFAGMYQFWCRPAQSNPK